MCRLVLAFCLIFFGLGESFAREIDKAEAWFNNITTLEARFRQLGSDGSDVKGKLYLKRPYWSRFEYDAPLPLTLITTQTWLHVDEKDARQVTSYPISETPIATLFSDPVRLVSNDFATYIKSENGIFSVILISTEGYAAGRLVLEFTQEPFELRNWILTDANGVVTKVILSDIRRGRNLPQRLFVPTAYAQDEGGGGNN